MGFFQDSSGDYSIMRLIFGIGMIWAMAMASGLAIAGKDISMIIAFFIPAAGVFTGLKLVQTNWESAGDTNTTTNTIQE